LGELDSKVNRAEENKDYALLQQLESEYTANILNVDNHSEYDYLCLRFNLRENTDPIFPKFGKIDYLMYFFGKGWRVLLTLCYFLLPLIFVLFWNLH
jgi:hypothetical protein